MRRILKYFGFCDNKKTLITEKQHYINSISKSLEHLTKKLLDEENSIIKNTKVVSNVTFPLKDGWELSAIYIDGYVTIRKGIKTIKGYAYYSGNRISSEYVSELYSKENKK